MDSNRWQWIPRVWNAYIDARIEEEVKKRFGSLDRADGVQEGSQVEPASSKRRANADSQTPKSNGKAKAKRVPKSFQVKNFDGKRPLTRRSLPSTHDDLLRELQETRRYLNRLEQKLVQITHKAGYTDFLHRQEPTKRKASRRSL
ncbi:MAG TPA: hypothetical protein VFV52_09490 [Bacilli bacterium]|nr:hypothetical protein [Bacilli bacterium]